MTLVSSGLLFDRSKSVFACDGEKVYELLTRKTKIKETTGAGDSLATGFVTGLTKKMSVPKALQLAYANATSVLEEIGAKNNLLTYSKALRKIKAKPARIKVL